MKRIVIRLAVLSLVVALGLIAIAQARFGKGTPADEAAKTDTGDQHDAPSTAPRESQPPANFKPLPANPLPTRAVDAGDRYPGAQSSDPFNAPRAQVIPVAGSDTLGQSIVDNSIPSNPAGVDSSAVPLSEYGTTADYPNPTAQVETYPGVAGESLLAPPAMTQPGAPPASLGGLGDAASPLGGGASPGLSAQPGAISPSIGEIRSNDIPNSQDAMGGGYDSGDSGLNDPNRFASPTGTEYPGALSPLASGDSTSALDAAQPPAALEPQHMLQGGAQQYGLMGEPGALGGIPAVSSQLATVEGAGRPGSKELEGPQAPVLTVTKQAPLEVQVGKECTFTITVRNDGAATAHQVRIIDSIPEGTQFVDSTPQASQPLAGQLVWQRETIDPGEELTIELRLMPVAEGELGSVARVEFETRASARVVATKPELSLRVSAPKTVMINDQLTLKIEITNPGSGPASGVMLLENVPAGLRHPAGAALEFEVGLLAPGESRDLELILTADQAGRIVNTITAKADASLHVEESVEFEVIAPALQVAVNGPTVRYLEREAVYTVDVHNPGTAAAKDVELVTHLPKGMKFVEANNHGHYDEATHAVYWGLPELPANETGEVELKTIPVEVGDQTLRVEGKAAQDLVDETRQTVTVEGLVAIRFEVVDIDDPIEIGGETSYEIRVVNQGTKAATNIIVAAALPPGLKAVAAEGPSRYEISGNQIVFEALRKLAPKADTTYRIKVEGVQPGDQRIRVQIVTDEVTTPVTKEESTQVYGDQ